MLQTLILELEVPDGELDPFEGNLSAGPLLQSLWMDHLTGLNSDISHAWHDQGGQRRPYHIHWPQRILNKPKRYRCRVSLLTPFACAMGEEFKASRPSSFQIKRQGTKLAVMRIERDEPRHYRDLVRRMLTPSAPLPTEIKLHILSPTAFRRSETRQIIPLPDPDLMMHSLIQRWRSCHADIEISGQELRGELAKHILINHYRLQSGIITVGGTAIPGFIGRLTLRLNGDPFTQGLIWLLFAFGEYAGLGMKTAMGMGDIRILNHPERRNLCQIVQ